MSRQMLMRASSQTVLGLHSRDIFQPAYTPPPNKLSAETPTDPPSLAEHVFSALAAAKIWTSKVAMHMDLAARNRYFRQLDLLHDCDEWFGADKPIQLESYKNFVRFMLSTSGDSKPSLALSPAGILIAIWENEGDRLTVEFHLNDKVHWVVSRREAEDTERVAGFTSTKRLLSNLAPYQPQNWL